MKKIRTGDEVVVITGKDKGKTATVKQFKDKNYVLIQGVNLVKKHVKPDPNKGIVGGIIASEMPIHISNIAIYNSSAKKGDRVGFRTTDDNKKVRYYKSTGELVK